MFLAILYIVIGAAIGVVINYLADVLPRTRRFSRPVCPKCEKSYSLQGYLISFKCAHCGSQPSMRMILVLILSMFASILVALFPLPGLNYCLTIPLMIFLGLILTVDIEHRVVLIETSIAGLILLFAYGFYLQGFLKTLIGGIGGFLIMLSIYYFGIAFSKILGKIRKTEISETALGFGDVYACGFLGFLTGWPYAVGMIVLAIMASGVFSLFYVLVKSLRKDYQAYTAIPYAPFLILGALATFYIP